MDKETLQNMDQNTYMKMLEDAAFDEINTMLNISKGHSQELHENITNEDLIRRIITEEKENISSFWDNESLKDGISNVVAYRAQAITKWLFKERYEFDNPKDYQKLCISADIGGDSVGHGFSSNNGVVKEKRDFCGNCRFAKRYGWRIAFWFLHQNRLCGYTARKRNFHGITIHKRGYYQQSQYNFRF